MRQPLWSTEAKDAARKGLFEHASSYTVSLFAISGRAVEIGTGVCLEYRNQFFIATAAHVARFWKRGAERGIIPRAPGSLVTDQRQVVHRLGFEPAVRDIVESRQPLDDLAIIYLDGRPMRMRDDLFYGVDLVVPPRVRSGTQVVLYGFPGELLRTWHHGQRLARFNVSPLADAPKVAGVQTGNPIFKSRKYRPALHFLMNYPEIRGTVNNPGGLSGAGVWAQEASGSKIWRPRLRLVGILVAWHEPTRLLIATRVKRLWRILESGKW